MNQKTERKRLHNKLWKLFSLFIRTRDVGRCFTCGIVKPIGEMNAGHYHDSSISNPELNFHPRNVHCQCVRCNHHLSGNKIEYSRNLVKKYGPEILDELYVLKGKVIKWSLQDYEVRIDELKGSIQLQKNYNAIKNS